MHGQSTGHADNLAGDQVRVVAGKKGHGARNVVRLAEALERNCTFQAFIDLLRIIIGTIACCMLSGPRRLIAITLPQKFGVVSTNWIG